MDFFSNLESFSEEMKKPEMVFLNESAKENLRVLHDSLNMLLDARYTSTKQFLYEKFLQFDKIQDVYIKNFVLKLFFDANESSYGDYFVIAYKFAMQGNEILFYGVINLIYNKLGSFHRMFYDDKPTFRALLEKISKKLNIEYVSEGKQCEFELFYNEYIDNIFPNRMICHKKDLCEIDESKYETTPFDIKKVEMDFKECVEREKFKLFIIELDNFINIKPFRENKEPKIYDYLFDALLGDFLNGVTPWNRELSISLFTAIINYYNCFETENLLRNSLTMEKYICEKLDRITKMLILLPVSLNRMGYDEIQLKRSKVEIMVFLINLYYAFPCEVIINFIKKWFLSDDYSSLIEYNLIDKDIISQINKEVSQLSEVGNRKISFFIPSKDKPVFAQILNQNCNPKKTDIHLSVYINDSKHTNVKLFLYDADGNEILKDKDEIVLQLHESRSGEFFYHITIFEGTQIKDVKACVVDNSFKDESFFRLFSSITQTEDDKNFQPDASGLKSDTFDVGVSSLNNYKDEHDAYDDDFQEKTESIAYFIAILLIIIVFFIFISINF